VALGGPNVFPSSKTWLGATRELNAGTGQMPGFAPGIAGMPSTIPLDKSSFEVEDTPHWLPDEAIRGSMAKTFSMILGPEDATFSYGGPFFGDVEGFFLDNAFGDLSTAYSGSFAGTATATAAVAVGGTAVTVSSGTAFTVGGYAQFGTSATAEVVALSNVAGSVLTFAQTPLRFAQGSGVSVYAIGTAPTNSFAHSFNILNSAQGYGGAYGAQPPTHCWADYLGPMTGQGSGDVTNAYGMRLYPGACVAQVDFTGNSEQLLQAKVTGTSWISTPAGTAPTNVVSAVVPVANWRSVVETGLPGSASTLGSVPTVGEWMVSVKRELQVYFTDQGGQNPYIIARGPLDATGTLNYTTPNDETPLEQMLLNVQPSVQIAINNGQPGTASTYLGLNIAMHQAAFTKVKPVRSSVLVGYDAEWQAVANAVNAGGSGGLGPCTVVLSNGIPTY
jgi:hypothetical protein